jgi:hypothetical protein
MRLPSIDGLGATVLAAQETLCRTHIIAFAPYYLFKNPSTVSVCLLIPGTIKVLLRDVVTGNF